jgi:carboxymethylenebutenolidase
MMRSAKHRFVLSGLALLLLSAACAGDSESASATDQEHAEAMAREHAGDDSSPSPAIAAEPTTEVTSSEAVYATVDGAEVKGFLALPAGAEAPPGVIVIHEWWGLNDNIRDMARLLAGEGYAALAVDLYRGEGAAEPEEARAVMQRAMEHPERLEADLAAAHAYLADQVGSSRVGVIGWCFGGGWALRAGLTVPELDAVVMYYGRVETSPEALESLQAPLLGHFGSADQGIPVESVRELETALDSLGKVAAIHVYEGAGHAFANASGSRYQADAAETAWARTLAFFEQHLENVEEDSEGETEEETP